MKISLKTLLKITEIASKTCGELQPKIILKKAEEANVFRSPIFLYFILLIILLLMTLTFLCLTLRALENNQNEEKSPQEMTQIKGFSVLPHFDLASPSAELNLESSPKHDCNHCYRSDFSTASQNHQSDALSISEDSRKNREEVLVISETILPAGLANLSQKVNSIQIQQKPRFNWLDSTTD